MARPFATCDLCGQPAGHVGLEISMGDLTRTLNLCDGHYQELVRGL